jgi:hypothetical protein
MVNIFKNLGLVNGTNAMTPLQVSQIGEILPNKDNISILEFGAGITTVKLYDAFKTKYNNVNYVTYEDNPEWVPKNEGIDVRMYNKKDLIEGEISIPSNEKYDIVIVDGPDGELRKYWYQIFKHNVKSNTIIHVDDSFHYPSFESELDSTFKDYDILFESGRKTWNNSRGNNKCWLTVKLK